MGFGAAALVAAQPREAHASAQFPELGLLLMPQRAATTPKNNGARIDTTRPQAIVVPIPEPRMWVG
jgi:vacuolar-type H+-ATPase subunit F/Vma7